MSLNMNRSDNKLSLNQMLIPSVNMRMFGDVAMGLPRSEAVCVHPGVSRHDEQIIVEFHRK